MPKQVAKNWFVSFNGTDISNSVETVSLGRTRGNGEITAFGDDYEKWAPGLKAFSFSAGMFQDYDAAAIESILEPLYSAGTIFTIIVRPDTGVVSTSNPQFTFTAFITDLPIDGTLKSVEKMTMTVSNSTALVKTTA